MALRIAGTTLINDTRGIVDYSILKNNLGNISSTATINLASGNFVTATVTGAVTITITTAVNANNAAGFVLELANGGAFTITWPASVKWPGGTAPALTASGIDVLTFVTDDVGVNWRAVASMLDSK